MSSKRITKVREKRAKRVRSKVQGTMERPRLSVFRSDRHIYVQAIADDVGKTLAQASTVSKELDQAVLDGKKIDVAKEVESWFRQNFWPWVYRRLFSTGADFCITAG